MAKLPSTYRARWALIVITLVMNGALVITSVAGYFAAQRSAGQTARSVGEAMVLAVKRDISRSPEAPGAVLEWAQNEMKQQGLRYVGIFNDDGIERYSAGLSSGPIENLSARGFRGRPQSENLHQPWSARALMPIGEHLGQGFRNRQGTGHHKENTRRYLIVVEVFPESARLIVSRAVWTLFTSLSAAAILLVIAVAFWRFSIRSDKIAAMSARDEQLKNLGRISAVLGHELRNPIASLKGHAQLLQKKIPEEHPSRNSVQTVLREVVRLENLTEQVLDFAKSGKLNTGPADPVVLVRAAVDRSRAEPVNLTLGERLPMWSLDSARMEQVLVNMLDNARQASEENEQVEMDVHLEKETLIIKIKDRGTGINQEDKEKIFQPFYTKRVKGTGLGLPLARKIVEEHGGTLTADNNVYGGATFTILLPRVHKD
jgi:two-component system, NtrC family, sensor histidine kinase HydH